MAAENKIDYENELSKIDLRINEIDKEISALQEEQKQLNIKAAKFKKSEALIRFANDDKEYLNENAFICYLDSTVETIPLMDKFIASGKKFLLFKGIIPHLSNAYLVVGRNLELGESSLIDSELTITNLKQRGAEILRAASYHGIDSYNAGRFYPLCEELNSENLRILNRERYLLFSQEIRLGAQTSKNRTGYGSVYTRYEYNEGTLYSETTSFWIIGAVVIGPSISEELMDDLLDETQPFD